MNLPFTTEFDPQLSPAAERGRQCSADGRLEYGDTHYAVAEGYTMLLPAAVGTRVFQPHGGVTLLEISLPEGK